MTKRTACLALAAALVAGLVPRSAPVTAQDDIVSHFKYGSVGTEVTVGLPYAIWRVLPVLFADKLPNRPGEGYERLGFIFESNPPQGRPIGTTYVEDRVALVLEGVLGYLRDDARRALLTSFARLFPRHLLLCDLLTRTFLARYARSLTRFLRAQDAEFAASSDHPEALFRELGYRTCERISVPQRAVELGAPGALPALVTRLLPAFRDGYCVWGFERGA